MRRMSKYLSPAKINWFLHITAQRSDGYHELETVFQRIDWCDELIITPRIDGQIILSGDLSGVLTSDNLAYRAARALQAYSPLGADIHLTKNIPTGAGLGGGSSNAATVLNALNDLWSLHLPNATLQEIGLTLGADVPFFVSGLNAAFATGVGEVLQPIDLPPREILLVNPNVHVATAAVFAHADLTRDHAPLAMDMHELSQLIEQANPQLSNDLQKATFALNQAVQSIYNALLDAAPQSLVRMSGSGATVFAAPFDKTERYALEVWRQKLPKQWHAYWMTTI